jgi:DNA-binding LacI/PurR family transcriptional regulator
MTEGSGLDGRPRMVDVGRLAQVSAQTVSRYFNGGYVGSETRNRIEQAVSELGYRPNAAARRLRSNRSESIGLLALGRPNFGIWSTLDGMTSAARAAGFTLVIGQLDIVVDDPNSPKEVHMAIEHLLRSGVDGVIVTTPYVRGEKLVGDLLGSTPSVVMSEDPGIAQNSVHTDSYQGARLAMEYLVTRGHRRILHIGGDRATIEAARREAGYLDVMAENEFSTLPVPSRDWTADAGYEIGQTLDPEEFSAIFAGNDLIASGAMSALRERGLSAPHDFSIVGIDDMPESRFAAPPLTSVAMGFAAVGAAAVEMLLERISTGRSVQRRGVAPQLRVRESVGAPRELR